VSYSWLVFSVVDVWLSIQRWADSTPAKILGGRMAAVNVSEAIGLLKSLKERHAELKALRDENSNRVTRFMGIGGDKSIQKDPVYSVTKLDRTVNRLAQEIRKLDQAIKTSNATTMLGSYDWKEEIMGLIETEDGADAFIPIVRPPA
jgi:hypothetical protein